MCNKSPIAVEAPKRMKLTTVVTLKWLECSMLNLFIIAGPGPKGGDPFGSQVLGMAGRSCAQSDSLRCDLPRNWRKFILQGHTLVWKYQDTNWCQLIFNGCNERCRANSRQTPEKVWSPVHCIDLVVSCCSCTVTIFFTKLPGMIDPLLLQVNLESREYACFVSTWSFQHVILIGGHSPLKFLLCRWVCRLFLATWSVASPSVGHAEVMLSQASAPWGSRRRSWGLGEPLGWTVWGCNRPWSEHDQQLLTSNSSHLWNYITKSPSDIRADPKIVWAQPSLYLSLGSRVGKENVEPGDLYPTNSYTKIA